MTVHRRRRLLAYALVSGAAACGAGPGRGPAPAPDAAEDPGLAVSRCRPPEGVSGRPQTIADLVGLVNALPRPLELTCFLESLDRPLDAQAVVSIISLQPARGQRNPRIFLLSGPLVMSVVPPVGTGSSLLELGQLIDDRRSIKAEIAFPVTGVLDQAYPYEKVREGTGTTCRFCHPNEERAEQIPDAPAFLSGAFSPDARYRVDLSVLARERQGCDDSVEASRCAMLRALLDHGEVREKDFPPTVPTIFER